MITNKKNQGSPYDLSFKIAGKEKRGINVMIGYVLLITFVLTMGIVVYRNLKTYVPQELLECPDGASIFIQDYQYNCTTQEFSLTLKNNGRFDLAGYFIRGTNDTDQEVATLNLKSYLEVGGVESVAGVLFAPVDPTGNPFKTEQVVTHFYNLTNSGFGTIDKIEIEPARREIINNKYAFASCTKSTIKEQLSCS